jgi:hypothetical protein
MTVFRLTTDASDLYRESTGDQYTRIVSSTESGKFLDETKNSTNLSKTVVAVPTRMVQSAPKIIAKVRLID